MQIIELDRFILMRIYKPLRYCFVVYENAMRKSIITLCIISISNERYYFANYYLLTDIKKNCRY